MPAHTSPVSARWPMRLLAPVAVALALLATSAPASAQRAEREVPIGGLIPLSNPLDPIGQCSAIAMELAIQDVNRYLEGNAAGIRFVGAIEDTRFDPQVALEKARLLHARGVQLIVGPQSSAELAQLAPFAEANDLLVVSYASTAGSLALPGDNIFRFTPSDKLEGAAVAALAQADGIRVLVPMWREDPGNEGVAGAVRMRFNAAAGTTLDGVSYGPDTRDFTASIAALRAQLDGAIARYGTDAVGVYLTGFQELGTLLAQAELDPVLRSVRWYGSNSSALSDAIVTDTKAAAFAAQVGYVSPVFGLDEGARDIWQPLHDRIRARTDHEPSAFAYATYDAVWAVARAYIASGATQDPEKLKRAFTTAAASGYGATGWTVLNEAGDRRHGDFDFWTVRVENGNPGWVRVARYESRTGRLVR